MRPYRITRTTARRGGHRARIDLIPEEWTDLMRVDLALSRRTLSDSQVNTTGSCPRVWASGGSSRTVWQAGGVLLVETACRTGSAEALSTGLAPWPSPGPAPRRSGPIWRQFPHPVGAELVIHIMRPGHIRVSVRPKPIATSDAKLGRRRCGRGYSGAAWSSVWSGQWSLKCAPYPARGHGYGRCNRSCTDGRCPWVPF